MTREVQGILMLLVGSAVLRLSVSDAFLNYVKEPMRPLLILSGAVLAVLGLIGVWEALTGRNHDEEPDATGGDGTQHDHTGGPRIAWLLVLPVFAIFLITPPALGSYSASREASKITAPPSDVGLTALPAGAVVDIGLLDYGVRAVWDQGRTVQGRTLRLTGFATPKIGEGWYLTRLGLSCCAADAQVFKVEVRGVSAPRPDSWVEVTGTWLPIEGAAREDAVAVLSAADVTPIDAPRNPYEE